MPRADVNIFPPVAFQAVLSEVEPTAILKTQLEVPQPTQRDRDDPTNVVA